jgi:hypothetical protein
VALLNAVHALKFYRNITFHGRAATSEVWTPPFLNGCSYGIRNYGVEVTFYGMTSLLNFIKIY